MNDSNLDFDSDALKLTPAMLASLLALLGGGKITGAAAKEVLREAFESGAEPEQIVEARASARSKTMTLLRQR
jgi:Asp-tRNA(Asn)/Glu-tRNA(Gln) amidotransferase B subunit